MTQHFNAVLSVSASGEDSSRETISRSLGRQEQSCSFGEVRSADSRDWTNPSSCGKYKWQKLEKSYFGFEGRE